MKYMKLTAFSIRNVKEIIRDPINILFGIGFPVVLMLLLSAIQSHIPTDLFAVERLTPGVAVFGLSFIALFSGTLISKDRSSSFLMRLYASPMSSADFILGYTLPLLPLALLQSVVCFIVAVLLGMEISVNLLLAIAVTLPAAVLFIAIGLLCGTVFNDKQVGGICGALLTNLSAWLSGTWFDVNLVGGGFKKAAELLPFYHAVEAARAAAAGTYASIFPHLWWVIGYAVALTVVSALVFGKRMNGNN